MSMKILGIEIERRTDILAFAAFLMSLSSILIQIADFIKGPNLTLENPSQILIESHLDTSNNKRYMRIAATMTYFNQGTPNYHDIVKSEEAHIMLLNNTIILKWAKYIHSKETQDDKLDIEILSNADPVQVKSGDVHSHETYFVPFPVNENNPNKNYIELPNFLNYLESSIKNGNKKLDIDFISTNFKDKKRKVTCQLEINHILLNLKQKNWTSVVCF